VQRRKEGSAGAAGEALLLLLLLQLPSRLRMEMLEAERAAATTGPDSCRGQPSLEVMSPEELTAATPQAAQLASEPCWHAASW
jgi:uncharacterized protein (DUF2345 family)